MSLNHIIDNQSRISLLKKKIKEKGYVKIIEAHNGMSALIINEAKIKLKNGNELEFDGIWESSFTDSASKGLPDREIVGIDSRLQTIHQILEVTNKPMIVDGDTGGDFNQFEYAVKRLERAGVSMVTIEDQTFPKRNSLETDTKHNLEKPEIFAEKIRRGIAIRNNPDFMIIARLESLIAGSSVEDALERAKLYLKAGADGVIIHASGKDPAPILKFAKAYNKIPKSLIKNKVLGCIPTTYNTITDKELAQAGFQIIIHANHLLRASVKAMENVIQKILLHDRSLEVDSDCASVKHIFEKVGLLEIAKKDKS